MFRNTVLCLTLQLLASLTESQILQNRQPWSYTNFEQDPRTEVARQNPAFLRPPPIQNSLQSASLSPKCTANLNENQQIIWDKQVKNPNTYTTLFDNNPNNYEKIIRKYDSMANPSNVVNNNIVAQSEQLKRIDNNYNKNRQYKGNANSYKTKKPRRQNEHPVRNIKEKGNKHRKHRQSEEHNRKKKDNKPLGDYISNYTPKTERTVDTDALLEIEKIEESLLNERENEKEATTSDIPSLTKKSIDKNVQDLSENDKQLGFEKSQTKKVTNKKRNKENRSTRNLKPVIDYQTNYFNPEEFNKYLQNFMAGNISNPYYFSNDMYPYIFDSLYKTSQDPTKSKNKNSNKRKNTNKSNKTNKNQNKEDECDTVIELSPNFHEVTPVTITTGTGPKKDIYLNLKIKKKDLPPNFDFNSNMPETTNDDYFQVDSDNEFSRKPFIINLFNPSEDDVEYYPDFTLFNHAYITSSEEVELDQIQNQRDYYQNDWEYYANRVKSYVEQSNKKSHTKPHVGFEPDLVTILSKNEKTFSDDLNMNVETIYAPSRVVSYSQTEHQTKNDKEEEENFWFKEGDTTIVLSRSL